MAELYNFQRPHQGIGGLTPADRFFGAAEEVERTLAARVQANARELAKNGLPKVPFYLTGRAGGQAFSVHAEGERVFLTRGDGRREIDLVPPRPEPGDPASPPSGEPPAPAAAERSPSLPDPVCPQGVVSAAGAGFEPPPALGTSPLDDGLSRPADGSPREGGGP